MNIENICLFLCQDDGEGTSENVENLENSTQSLNAISQDTNVEDVNNRTSVSPVQHQPMNGEHEELRKHNFLNGSFSQEVTKERIKNAFKNNIPNMTTRSFSKASDLFRKKKKAKNRHHHSIHLTVPDDDAGETTTDFEEGDSDGSIDDTLDDGNFFFNSLLID